MKLSTTDNIEFYPNPFHSVLNINSKLAAEKAVVNIMSVNGKTIKSFELNPVYKKTGEF